MLTKDEELIRLIETRIAGWLAVGGSLDSANDQRECAEMIVSEIDDSLCADYQRQRTALIRIWHLYPKASEAATIAAEGLGDDVRQT